MKGVRVLNEKNRNHVLIRQEEAVHHMVGCRFVNALVQEVMDAEFKGISQGLRGRLDNFMEGSITAGN